MNKHQRGGVVAAVLITLGVIGAVVGLGAFACASAYNTANAFEQQLKAEHANNKNILAQYGQKVAETVQVTAMARDDMSKVAKDALSARYGQDGSKATVQAINEQNPVIDNELYRKPQQLIESGRDEFEKSQKRLTDIKRSYETALGSFPQGNLMRALGYPKVPLDTYNIVTTDRAEKAFETGREEPLQLRK